MCFRFGINDRDACANFSASDFDQWVKLANFLLGSLEGKILPRFVCSHSSPEPTPGQIRFRFQIPLHCNQLPTALRASDCSSVDVQRTLILLLEAALWTFPNEDYYRKPLDRLIQEDKVRRAQDAKLDLNVDFGRDSKIEFPALINESAAKVDAGSSQLADSSAAKGVACTGEPLASQLRRLVEERHAKDWVEVSQQLTRMACAGVTYCVEGETLVPPKEGSLLGMTVFQIPNRSRGYVLDRAREAELQITHVAKNDKSLIAFGW